jgi:hypothetical protein
LELEQGVTGQHEDQEGSSQSGGPFEISVGPPCLEQTDPSGTRCFVDGENARHRHLRKLSHQIHCLAQGLQFPGAIGTFSQVLFDSGSILGWQFSIHINRQHLSDAPVLTFRVGFSEIRHDSYSRMPKKDVRGLPSICLTLTLCF